MASPAETGEFKPSYNCRKCKIVSFTIISFLYSNFLPNISSAQPRYFCPSSHSLQSANHSFTKRPFTMLNQSRENFSVKYVIKRLQITVTCTVIWKDTVIYGHIRVVYAEKHSLKQQTWIDIIPFIMESDRSLAQFATNPLPNKAIYGDMNSFIQARNHSGVSVAAECSHSA